MWGSPSCPPTVRWRPTADDDVRRRRDRERPDEPPPHVPHFPERDVVAPAHRAFPTGQTRNCGVLIQPPRQCPISRPGPLHPRLSMPIDSNRSPMCGVLHISTPIHRRLCTTPCGKVSAEIFRDAELRQSHVLRTSYSVQRPDHRIVAWSARHPESCRDRSTEYGIRSTASERAQLAHLPLMPVYSSRSRVAAASHEKRSLKSRAPEASRSAKLSWSRIARAAAA